MTSVGEYRVYTEVTGKFKHSETCDAGGLYESVHLSAKKLTDTDQAAGAAADSIMARLEHRGMEEFKLEKGKLQIWTMK